MHCRKRNHAAFRQSCCGENPCTKAQCLPSDPGSSTSCLHEHEQCPKCDRLKKKSLQFPLSLSASLSPRPKQCDLAGSAIQGRYLLPHSLNLVCDLIRFIAEVTWVQLPILGLKRFWSFCSYFLGTRFFHIKNWGLSCWRRKPHGTEATCLCWGHLKWWASIKPPDERSLMSALRWD